MIKSATSGQTEHSIYLNAYFFDKFLEFSEQSGRMDDVTFPVQDPFESVDLEVVEVGSSTPLRCSDFVFELLVKSCNSIKCIQDFEKNANDLDQNIDILVVPMSPLRILVRNISCLFTILQNHEIRCPLLYTIHA